MKIFHCNHCNQLVYFENTSCLNCGAVLAYLPDRQDLCSLESDGPRWRLPEETHADYRLCENYVGDAVCNWAVRVDDNDAFCISCRLNNVIPDLSVPGNRAAWGKLERAKRRLNYSLLALGLPVVSRKQDVVRGVAYEFLADNPGVPALTGHEHGIITLNIAEADDAEREKRRLALHEPYRTLLGHFRHEIGHYYWDVFFEDSPRVEGFRKIFGDETFSYDEALKIHYAKGAPDNWQDSFISAYATTHPWEDWAETWAHYLHMSDTLETAAAFGLKLAPRRADEPRLEAPEAARSFDQMVENWYPLTHMLNSLNRGLGLADGYPFVISQPVIEKLRFIHETIASYAAENPTGRFQEAAA